MFQQVNLTALPNGVRVVSSALPHVASVSFGIWTGVGARYEAKAVSGISHFIEHLLFKGSRTRSCLEITQEIEGRGGYLNAFTQEESTCYYARVPSDKTRHAIDVLTDMFLNPKFASEDIEKERQVIIEEMMMYRDQPHHYVTELLQESLWMNHPLGRPVIGDECSIGKVSRQTIAEFKTSRYVPANTVFAFAGDVVHDDCVRAVAAWVSDMPAAVKPRFQRIGDGTPRRPRHLIERSIEQTHLALGFRLFGRRDDRRYPLKLLNTILGENMSSRLFQVVRERHGMAYSVHSSTSLFAETGCLTIEAGLDRRKGLPALKLIVRELSRLKRRKASEQEMRRARDYVTGQLKLNLESTSAQMMWLGDNVLEWGRFVPPEESIEKIMAVTADDVQRLANAIFVSDEASLAAITPVGEGGVGDALQAALGAM